MNKYWITAVFFFCVFALAACTPEGVEFSAGISQTAAPVIEQTTQPTPTLAPETSAPILLPLPPDAAPDKLPVYLMAQDPLPMNGALALAWADSFGLPNAKVAEVTDEVIRILSRDSAAGTFEELTFINTLHERVIIYSTGPDWQNSNSPTVTPISDPQELPVLPAERVTAVALEFVREHGLLAEPLIAHEFPSPGEFYRVHVSYSFSGLRLTGIGEVPGVTLRIDGNGRVVEARIVEASYASIGNTVVRPLREVYPAYQQGTEWNVYYYERAHLGGIAIEDWLRFQAHSVIYGDQGDRAELVYTSLPLQPERLVPMWLITRPQEQSWHHYDEIYLLAAEGENIPRPIPSPTAPTPIGQSVAPTSPSVDPQMPAPTATPIPTMTPVVNPSETAVPLSIDSFALTQVEELNPGKRLTFEWSTSGAGGVCLISGTARRMGPWWPVPHSGALTVEVEHTIYRDPEFTLQAYAPGGYCAVPEAPSDLPYYSTESITVTWPCALDYFFSPAPRRCPTSSPPCGTSGPTIS